MKITIIQNKYVPVIKNITTGKEYDAVSIEQNEFVYFYEITNDIGEKIVVTDCVAKEVD